MSRMPSEREGRPLGDWLLDVVGPNVQRRGKALEVLQAMELGLESVHQDFAETEAVDLESARPKYLAELRRTLHDAEYPGAEVIRGLAALITGEHDRWLRINREEDARFERITDRMMARAGEDPEKRTRAFKRLGSVICAESKRDPDAMRHMMHSALAANIFRGLGPVIAIAPQAVRDLLKTKDHRYIALEAIAGAGTEVARLFLPDIMPDGKEMPSDAIAPLATVGIADARVIRRACADIERALAGASPVDAELLKPARVYEFAKWFYDGASAWTPVNVLRTIGPAARGVEGVDTDIVSLLMRLSRSVHIGQRAAAAHGVGRCAAGSDPQVVREVCARLLELTHDHQWIAGRAVDGLGELVGEAGPAGAGIDTRAVVARLNEMLGTYEEFDPDTGQDERLCTALCAYADVAADALPRLRTLAATRLKEWSEESEEIAKTIRVIEAAQSGKRA